MEPFFSERMDGTTTVVDFLVESLMSSVDLERISRRLYDIVDEEHRSRLTLDFAKVRYLSSQAIGILITLKKKVDADGGKLILKGVGPQLMQLLKVTNLHRMFTIQPA